MKRFIPFLLVAIGLLGLGVPWYLRSQDAKAQAAIEDGLRDLRRDFREAVGPSLRTEDVKAYRRGVQAALKDYESKLKKVYAKRPEWRDTEAYETRIKHLESDGEIPESAANSRLEAYGVVKKAYARLQKGDWQSELTQASPAAEVRLDAYDFRQINAPDGSPILEADFFLWGVQDTVRVSWKQVELRYWAKSDERVKKGRRSVTEEVEKVIGRAEGDATPRFIITSPNDYISEFPASVSVGQIWLPVMPAEASRVEITYSFMVRKETQENEVVFKWDLDPVPASWKLSGDQVWKAETLEATDDEIRGQRAE